MTRAGRANPLALAVLTCLFDRPMHPYEVAQTLRNRATHLSIRLNYGSLYGVVESMEKRGLIAAKETLRDGRRPERTVYEITEAGRLELVDWLSDLLSVPEKEYLQFEAALSLLSALPPDDALALLHARARVLEIEQGERQSVHVEGLPRLFLLEHDYMTALQAAELTFVRDLIQQIESGSLDGIDQWLGFHEPVPEKGDPHP
jgi:DNA-binding PadR family transcriptional regulator